MAITDIQIQTGITIYRHRGTVRGSDGTLYTVYAKDATGGIWLAYSTDSGATWTEVNSGSLSNTLGPALAIDSQDNIHVAYSKAADAKVYYRKISGLTWGNEEAVSTNGVLGGDSISSIAVDSTDTPHITWVAVDNDTHYSSRAGGSWSAELEIAATGSEGNNCVMVIDSNDDIYVIMNGSSMVYVKYTGTWSAPVTIGTASILGSTLPSVVVDSLDNVHVVWATTNVSEVLYYVKYTKLTDTWGAAGVVTTATAGSNVEAATIGIDSSDVLTVLFNLEGAEPKDTFLIQNVAGVWGTDSKILDASAPHGFQVPRTQTTLYPIIGGMSTQIPTAGYHFTYLDLVSGSYNLRYYSSTDIDFPAPVTKNYSRDDTAALAATDSNLNAYTSAGYSNVLTEDSIFEDQSATAQYAVHLFKNKGNSSSDNISVSWVGKAALAPTTSTVYLQIYNRTSGLWETLDSNASSGANTVFTLSGSKTSGLSNYYDGSNWVSCRVYQSAL